jgi:hypothetical protein
LPGVPVVEADLGESKAIADRYAATLSGSTAS